MYTPNKQILEGKYTGEEVSIIGWVQNSRSHGKLHFLNIRDGTGVVQATAISDRLTQELYQTVTNLGEESSVIVKGIVRQDQRAPGGYEIQITGLNPIQVVKNYPLAKKTPDVEYLRDNRHLWIRSPSQKTMMELRAEVVRQIRKYLNENNFVEVFPPILTTSSCEDPESMFKTTYFGNDMWLTQSGQLYLEAFVPVFGKVYGFDPSFRAEKSRTTRHIAEFWQVEPEMVGNVNDAMILNENLIYSVVKAVLNARQKEFESLNRNISELDNVKPPFPRITYDQAIDVLKRKGSDIEWGENLGAPHEKMISDMYDIPVYVTEYPTKSKAFYMQPKSDRPEVTLCFDLLGKFSGEMTGGSERISDYDLLLKRLEENNLPKDKYEWYLDLRRYGTVQHSGFGTGIERLLMFLTGKDDIYETVAFPRTMRRFTP